MAPATLACAFEPFFTTTAEGAGTALGLATVHGIVTQAGGSVWLETVEGRGTMVVVWLPGGERELKSVGPESARSRCS